MNLIVQEKMINLLILEREMSVKILTAVDVNKQEKYSTSRSHDYEIGFNAAVKQTEDFL